MAKWIFTCIDNGGKRQAIKIMASDKTEAINKGFKKAKEKAQGDICASGWNCKLIKA